MSKKKRRRKEGDVVRIALGEEWAFGRVLREPLIAFYDFKAKEVPSMSEIVEHPIAFKLWVMNYAVTDGDWPVVGNVPLTPELEERTPFFKRDPISKKLSITFTGGGDEQPASLEQCKNLECAAVWEPEHVVERLKDHFAGRPNIWAERLKAIPEK